MHEHPAKGLGPSFCPNKLTDCHCRAITGSCSYAMNMLAGAWLPVYTRVSTYMTVMLVVQTGRTAHAWAVQCWAIEQLMVNKQMV